MRAARGALVTVGGGLLVVVGVALLVLPGPGLVLVAAGLALLSSQYEWARRLLRPVQVRAADVARLSVTSRWRLAGSLLCAAGLLAAGILVLVLPLPGGVGTAVSLMFSGLILVALIVYSRRRFGPSLDRDGRNGR